MAKRHCFSLDDNAIFEESRKHHPIYKYKQGFYIKYPGHITVSVKNKMNQHIGTLLGTHEHIDCQIEEQMILYRTCVQILKVCSLSSLFRKALG